MQFSDKGISLLKTLEGFRGKPYPDSGGKMTVGYGHLIIPGDGVVLQDIIDPVKGTELLCNDIKRTVAGVNNCVTSTITQDQFDALVVFAYNVGVTAFSKSTLLRMLNMGDVDGAYKQFLKWDMVGKDHIPGLLNRRLAEQALFLGK